MVNKSIELILIEDNKNLRFELQNKRTSNSIGPFIRIKSKLYNQLGCDFSDANNDILLALKAVSPFLEFPIVVEKTNIFYSDIYIKAQESEVKIYSYTKNKSLKRTAYKNIHRYEFIDFSKENITECVIYIEFKQSCILVNPFIKVSSSTQLLPFYPEAIAYIKEQYSELDNSVWKHANDYMWRMSNVDFNLLHQSSQEYINNKTLKILIKKDVVKKHSSYSKNNGYDIDWLDSKLINVDSIVNNRIITNYLINKQYSSFDDFNEENLNTNNKNKSNFEELTSSKNTALVNRKIKTVKNNKELADLLAGYGFIGILKEHQYHGVHWILDKYTKNQRGVLLADEMGLGKTIQSLSILVALYYENFNCIIVCPSSLKHNWYNEINKFFPLLIPKTNIIESQSQAFKPGINILSCEMSKIHKDIDSQNFDLLIFDEAQRIKNKKIKLWEKINKLEISFKLLLTGSPVENSEVDLLNLIEVVSNPKDIIHWEAISHNVAYKNEERENKISVIRAFFKNYIIYRNKEECLTLPECKAQYVSIEMDESMRKTYSLIREQFLYNLSKNKGAHSFMALDALLRLRQLCSLPSLIKDEFPDLDINLLSPKADKVEEIIESTIAQGGKVVLFSVFIGVLCEFEYRLKQKSILTARIDGSLNTTKRKGEIDKFTNNYTCKVLLSSLHVGGVGLNLVEANTVILYNSWWNPAVENQAISRVHRMGQNREVNVYIPVYKDSVEEKIQVLLENKRKLTNSFTDYSLNNQDYIDLLK